MKIAVIGSGISGLTAAYLCHFQHDVTVFERDHRIGGHTATIDVDYRGDQQRIDTGFIVFNDRTYPKFIKLLKQLGVAFKTSSMGFSVSNPNSGLEYAGNSLGTLFAQKRNIISPSFWKMLIDIVRFNRVASKDVIEKTISEDESLASYLNRHRLNGRFRDDYLVPMGAAIWSASFQQILNFPAKFFLEFYDNHGLLSIFNKPQWYVIQGGSKAYIPNLISGFAENIETGATIVRVLRSDDHVTLEFADGTSQQFDHVIFAAHSDQALALLGDPSAAEKEILAAIPYQDNSVVLHSDETMLPRSRKVWSSWNYCMSEDSDTLPTLTYNMNILQGLETQHTYCVTLNADDQIDQDRVIGKFTYAHPQFSVASYRAQARKGEICGTNRTSYCGAYWGSGFHEDGVVSAIDAISRLGIQSEL